MAKIKPWSIPKKERESLLASLLDLASGFRSRDETMDFLFGMLTPSETLMLARRVRIAELLLEDMTYDHIRDALGVGYKTIANVEHWIRSGNEDRDRWLADSIRTLSRKQKRRENEKKRTGGRTPSMSLLSKYAHHRFLSEILSEILR
jgi:uncharacterized protein YerC